VKKPHNFQLKKIADFLDVIKKTHTGHRDDPRVLERIKESYHNDYVIKPEHIPESTFLLEQRIAREEGWGTVEITDEFREQKTQQIITNQESSLDSWVDYLSSEDATYPMWAKYWAFTSIVQMGKFEKVEKEKDGEKNEFGRFTKRTKNTVASFPMLNPRALAMTIGAMKSKLEQRQKPKKERKQVENLSVKLDDPDFQQLLSTENFSKLYVQFLIEMPEYSTEGLQETRGKWVKYERGSDPKPLVDSLEGYPLEWCTANIDTAYAHLQGGDFHVYYSINEAGEAIIPRLAIRTQDDKIAESPRGIALDQNLDPYIGDVLEKKLDEFPDKEVFKKKTADMRKLTKIDKKVKNNKDLTKDDLIFLYEIDQQIEGFGYERDPRIEELREGRDPKEDAPIIFECDSQEIAYNKDQITKNTKAYIGSLFPKIFQKLSHIDHIYTSFPEGKIRKYNIEIGGKDKDQLKKELQEKNIYISNWADDLLRSKDFATSKTVENANLVRLTVSDLGLPSGGTTDEIYKRANDLGLELCPAEVGPNLRLQYSGKEWMLIAMKQISDRPGYPDVFYLYGNADRLKLYGYRTRPSSWWRSGDGFVFSLRKLGT
jgi:hypothetical protein